MSFSTSDFHNPICLEMKLMRSGEGGPMEMGSIDSSETFASCNTQPFHSQGDLTEDSNLYVNPMESRVKKSASGDTALRTLTSGPQCLDEMMPPERGSRGSLNEPPLPKHRKTRFQQQDIIYQPRFEDEAGRGSQESLETIKKKRTSFMPSKPLATATRLINQHLFGLHSLSKSNSKCKNGESRSSLSVDSIDSRSCPTPETHRRSKSILKKHETSGHNHRPLDPETEKLIDSSDYSPIRRGGGGGGIGASSEMKSLKFGSDLPPLYICPPPPPMDHSSPTEETSLLSRPSNTS